MIDPETGNRIAPPQARVIKENGSLWLKTRDGRLHHLTKEECLWLGHSAFERLFGLGMVKVCQPNRNPPEDVPSAYDV